jgi:hypothetical protein
VSRLECERIESPTGLHYMHILKVRVYNNVKTHFYTVRVQKLQVCLQLNSAWTNRLRHMHISCTHLQQYMHSHILAQNHPLPQYVVIYIFKTIVQNTRIGSVHTTSITCNMQHKYSQYILCTIQHNILTTLNCQQ